MKEFINNLKFAWQYTKDQKKVLILYVIINIISIVLRICVPILSAKIMISLTNNEFVNVIVIALIILITNYISNFIDYFAVRCSTSVYSKTLSKFETELGRNVLKLENDCLDKHGSGLFIQRLTNDTSRLSDVFNSLFELLSRLIRYIGFFIAILIINRTMFIYAFISLVFLYVFESKKSVRRNKDDKVYRKSQEEVSSFIGELVRGARDIKMLNSEDNFLNRLSGKLVTSNENKRIMEKNVWNYNMIIWNSIDTFTFIHTALLVYFMYTGVMQPAIALILHNYYNSLSGSFYLFGNIFQFMKDFNLSSERIRAIINNDEFKKEEFGKKHLDKVNGNFEFKNVSFSYDEKDVLKDLSFKIKENETVAFVGKSGVGKTTIFSLLCKMYNIKSGSITIDGVDINELDKESIRGNITIISQNPYIFNMSIRDNLMLVKKDLSEEEMKKACKIACLEEFINELPNGYDTIIGEGGVNLSGGQKQRLAIARALVQKTEIILFDEATSALDNETQEKIGQAIDNMKNEYTIMIIAHRLSTIINADRILYLDDGKIKAEGTHNELLKNCAEYRNLYESEINKD